MARLLVNELRQQCLQGRYLNALRHIESAETPLLENYRDRLAAVYTTGSDSEDRCLWP